MGSVVHAEFPVREDAGGTRRLRHGRGLHDEQGRSRVVLAR